MDMSLLLWLALATLLFWGVGLYNRLMRLRARSFDVLGVVQKHAGACVELVKLYVAAHSDDGQANATDQWFGVHTAASHLERILEQARTASQRADAVSSLSGAWTAMHVAWLQASEGPTDLAGPVMPPEMQDAWTAASLKVQSASGGYNQIVARYNDAIQQYPARWVAGLMGFHAAQKF